MFWREAVNLLQQQVDALNDSEGASTAFVLKAEELERVIACIEDTQTEWETACDDLAEANATIAEYEAQEAYPRMYSMRLLETTISLCKELVSYCQAKIFSDSVIALKFVRDFEVLLIDLENEKKGRVESND